MDISKDSRGKVFGAVPPAGGTPLDGWSMPEPATLPEPTYWPATLALGIVLLFWGVVTSVVISSVGLILAAVALVGWIGELRHEHQH